MKMHRRYVLLVTLIVFVVSGCAHLPGNRKSEKSLRERVTQEWEAKINGDWGIVYDLTTKEFKSKVKRDKYIGGKSLAVVSYEINEITMDPEQGKASVQVGFDINYRGNPFKGARTKEEWIWEDGKWRLNLKQKISPFH